MVNLMYVDTSRDRVPFGREPLEKDRPGRGIPALVPGSDDRAGQPRPGRYPAEDSESEAALGVTDVNHLRV